MLSTASLVAGRRRAFDWHDRRTDPTIQGADLIERPYGEAHAMRGSLIRSVILVAFAASLSACALSEGEVGDLVYLHNTTETPLTVTHEIEVSGGPTLVGRVGDVDPGQGGYFSKADLDENDCMRGSLVARDGEVVVDEIAGLCRPVRWEIGQP